MNAAQRNLLIATHLWCTGSMQRSQRNFHDRSWETSEKKRKTTASFINLIALQQSGMLTSIFTCLYYDSIVEELIALVNDCSPLSSCFLFFDMFDSANWSRLKNVEPMYSRTHFAISVKGA